MTMTRYDKAAGKIADWVYGEQVDNVQSYDRKFKRCYP